MTDGTDRQRALLEAAFGAYRDGAKTSAVLDLCIRLARARGDWINTWILSKEALDQNMRRAVDELNREIIDAIGRETFDAFRKEVSEDWIERRTWDDGQGEPKVHPQGVAQIEEHMAYLERMLDRLPPPAFTGNEHEHEVFGAETVTFEGMLLTCREILARVRQRCHTYLVRTEAAIGVTEAAQDTFARVRERVDTRLATVSRPALEEFRAAYERAATGDPAALSHALLSCRRVLNALADALYPATGASIRGADGVVREMTDDKYINRLIQYAVERIASSTSRRLTLSSLEEVGRRLEAAYELASKGVHDDVTQAEADQCIVQTYLLAADFLSLPHAVVA